MHATKTRPKCGGNLGSQRAHRQSGCVRGNPGRRAAIGRNLCIEGALDVHALGDCLDDELGFGKPLQMVIEVIGPNQAQHCGAGKRCRFEFFESLQGRTHELIAILGRAGQIEKIDCDACIGQMASNLCAHHASAQHGNTLNSKLIHECSLFYSSSVAHPGKEQSQC